MPAPACPARSAGTPSARSASPTPRCSTARPARPGASRWPIDACPSSCGKRAGTSCCQTARVLVTFDLFSALLDARTGGSAAFGQIVAAHGWDIAAEDLYDRWDAANKASQRDETEWMPFTGHSSRALAAVYAELGLDG